MDTEYHDRFDEILTSMSALHMRKGADYGGKNDPYANVRASAEFGVAPWIGALIRLNDKITRLKSFIRKGVLENESVADSIQDIAVYAVIMRILYDEECLENQIKSMATEVMLVPPPKGDRMTLHSFELYPNPHGPVVPDNPTNFV